jgi:hypothetical protein
MKSTVFWIVTPYSLDRAQRSEETYRLNLQGLRVIQKINQRKQPTSWALSIHTLSLLPASVGFLLGLSLDLKMVALCSTEWSGSLRNTSCYITNDRASFCLLHIAAYRPVAKWRLCEKRPLLGNACNIHARNNGRTVFSMWSVPRCYNREVWSLVRIVSSVREAVKRGPQRVKLKNLHC